MKLLRNVLCMAGIVLGLFSGATYSKEVGPGFDIINKSGKTVTMRLINGSDVVVPKKEVKKAVTLLTKTIKANNVSAKIDTSKGTLLVIWDGDLKQDIESSVTSGKGDAGTESYFSALMVKPKPSAVYHFKPGKNIYVTLREKGKLTPQSGPAKGAKGVTEAGYMLEGNVTEPDILQYSGKMEDLGAPVVEPTKVEPKEVTKEVPAMKKAVPPKAPGKKPVPVKKKSVVTPKPTPSKKAPSDDLMGELQKKLKERGTKPVDVKAVEKPKAKAELSGELIEKLKKMRPAIEGTQDVDEDEEWE